MTKYYLNRTLLLSAVSCLFFSSLYAGQQYKQLSCVMHIHTNYSEDRTYTLKDVIDKAKKAGIDVVIPTDHDFVSVSYGVFPFQNLVKKTYSKNSIMELGPEKYLGDIEKLRRENPDMVIVMDDSLLESVDVTEGIEKNGILLINTSKTKEAIAGEIKNKNCKIYTIDASGIAKELFGKNLPNTVIVGSIAKLIPSVSYKDVVRKLKEKFDAKLSEEIVRKNIEALERGYGAF